jgi:hypothetical protein
MLAKIIPAGAVILLLAGGALASGSTVSTLHTQQGATSEHDVYARHHNSPIQRYAASTAPNGYNDTQGSHALGGGPG